MEPSDLLRATDDELRRWLTEFDEMEMPRRTERLREVNAILARGPDWGFMHSGGMEASWLLSEAKDTYVYGFYSCSLMASHAACERRLAGTLTFFTFAQPIRGSERWGLGKLLDWASEATDLPAEIIERLRELSETRKQLAHYRNVTKDTSVYHRVPKAQTDDEWYENLAQVLRDDALAALDLAYELYFGMAQAP